MKEQQTKLVTRTYKLGGMQNTDSVNEVTSVMEHIEGVANASVSKEGLLTLTFNQDVVQEDHLKSTLSSLGHGILNDGR